MKKVVAAIAAILAIVAFVAYSHLGGAVKSIIENAGSEVLGTPVHVGGVTASLATRTASVKDIYVSNPSGFKGDFLQTNGVSATLGGIEGKTITIKEILVDGMTVTYELGAGGTNFDVFKKNLKSTPVSSAAAKTENKTHNGGYDLIIQKIRIVNAKVIPSIGSMTKSVTLPEIIVSNIGSKGNPATPEQVAKQLMEHVLAISGGAATKLGLSSLPAELKIDKTLNVDKAKSQLNGLLSR